MQPPLKILILCTGNSCRSILAEAALNYLGQGRIEAYSAGSKPAGHVHPKSLALLAAKGIPTQGLRSKSWDEFDDKALDAVITVCDSAAGEACPVFPSNPVKAHWGMADPAAATGTDAEITAVFAATYDLLQRRINALLKLPATLDRAAFTAALRAISTGII